jgi:hypothetical protein
VATFDLNVLPIQRINGQELADMPGLLAVTPPRKAARKRNQENLVIHLVLSGNAALSADEVVQLTRNASDIFYQSPGTLTSAMRKAAEEINTALLERNLSTTGRGQYAIGWLAVAVMREDQCTVLLSGPMHAVWVSEGQSRHIHDPALSGKGLGSSQSFQTYFSQIELHTQDLLTLCAKFPADWEADLLNERPPSSLDASYRKLTFAKGDLNAVLIQTQLGHGTITILRPEGSAPPPSQLVPVPVIEASNPPDFRGEKTGSSTPSISEEELDSLADFAAHYVQPSAYAIPPQPESVTPLPNADAPTSATRRSFPPSIPRVRPAEPKVDMVIEEDQLIGLEIDSEPMQPDKPSAHAEAARQMAKVVAGGIKTGRRVNERIGVFLQRFIPRLIPNTDSTQPLVVPTYLMVFMAVVIPVLVVTVASVVYLRFGQSVQYDEYYSQALTARAQAISQTDPVLQRYAWQNVLNFVDRAEEYRSTDESNALRVEAQANLDTIMGIVRLNFVAAFTNGLGGSAQISRMAASESDLYMLDAERGSILHASFSGSNLALDNKFDCKPGTYNGYSVGTLVDLLALPKANSRSASVLGIDATGNLLYCAPGQVPQASPLPSLPNTNWKRVTAFALDNGNLYVLDAESRAVWVFVGKNATFVDAPYFYFGNQIPAIDNAIDLAVSGDDLYMLHADGHLSACTFSRIAESPTRCIDPVIYQDVNPAHQDINIFAQAHFTQMTLTTPPNPVILLLDSENRSVFRFLTRSLELQNQFTGYAGKANPFQAGPIGAMAVSPNYILYLAIGNQVYFAANLP